MDFKLIISKKEKGFSLVEVLIYIAVAATLLMVATGFIREILKVRNKVTILSKVEQSARFAMNRMVTEIRFAESVEVLDENTLRLSVSDPERDPVLFDLADGVLYVREGASEDWLALTGNDVKVGDVLFDDRTTPNSADIVKVTLSVSHPDTNLTPDSQAVIELETYVARR